MHRLRTKKKTKGADDEDIPPVPALSKGFFGRSKPVPQEPPQVELEFALPPTDDFRTSLLMPNLANRFSILKQEQAAAAAAAAAAAKDGSFVAGPDIDGHVLCGPDGFSSSRFMGLGDIAETSSISGSVASAHDRLTSNSEERRISEEDSTSVMNRSRPQGEGNVLFGGRQKVYKIAPKALRGGTSSMEDLRMGRSVSRDDLPGYHFSRRHTAEKDGEEDGDNKGDDLPEHDKNRYTSSSTNSTPTTMTRTSTAATSINSQPGHSAPVPSTVSLPQSPTVAPAKTRRPLYEQALDQQLQDQQSSAMGRLERLASLRRIGSVSPTRSDSPVLGCRGSPQLAFHTSPTTSPTSRPAMPWSTNKKAMPPPPAVEAESPPLDATKPPRPAGFDKFDFGIDLQRVPSPPDTLKTTGFPTQGPFSPGMLNRDRYERRSPERERVTSPVLDRRSSVSLGAVGSPRHSENHEARPTAFLASSATSSERSSMEQDLVIIQHIGDELDDAARDISSSDSSSPPTSAMKSKFPDPAPAADEPRPESPAYAASQVSSLDDEPSKQFLEALRPLRNPEVSPPSPKFTVDAAPPGTDDDSPTLPPGQGLSLLVRQHLRSDSGSSSMYAASTYRLSRVSRHGVTESTTKPTVEPRVSTSSAGDNVWQYDEFAHHNDDEPPSPSNMYSQPVPQQFVSPSPPEESTYRLTGRSNTTRGRQLEDDEGQSQMERKYGRQSEDHEGRSPPSEEVSYRPTGRSNTIRGRQSEDDFRRSEMGRGYGRQSEDDQRRFDLERKYGRQLEDNERRAEKERKYRRQSEDDRRRYDLERKFGRRVEEPERGDDRRTESTERRGRRRAESRAETERGPSRAGTERSLSRAGEGDNQDRDWVEQLAFRRQLVQQNLRNQEKIQSHHEAEGFRDSPVRNGGTLRSKGSNGFLRDAGRPPVIMGPNGPMLADGGRGRGWHDGRVDGERHGMRGPHGIPPGPQFPNRQPRPTQRQRPPLVTNNTFGNGPDPMLPDGRLRKSPSGARLRPGPPHDMINGGSISAGNTPRGQPMGWQESWEPVPNSRSQPTTPIPRGPPTRPPYQQPGDGYRDDLSRAMMTGQSSVAEPAPRQQSPRKRTGSSPDDLMENVKSTFEEEEHRPLSFRRPRGNSLIGGRKGPTENPPLPQINTSVLLGPSNNPAPGTRSAGPGPAPSPAARSAGASSGSAVPSPAAKSPQAILQQIESANSVLAVPARKKAIDKYQIGQPTLLSMTSTFDTIDLPGAGSGPLTTPPSTASSSKSRKRTNTLFGAFGRGNSDDQVPDMPRSDIDFDDSKSSKSVGRNKLRKSISDGGSLSSRARVNERVVMREHMPRIQRVSPAMDKEIGGMI